MSFDCPAGTDAAATFSFTEELFETPDPPPPPPPPEPPEPPEPPAPDVDVVTATPTFTG